MSSKDRQKATNMAPTEKKQIKFLLSTTNIENDMLDMFLNVYFVLYKVV